MTYKQKYRIGVVLSIIISALISLLISVSYEHMLFWRKIRYAENDLKKIENIISKHKMDIIDNPTKFFTVTSSNIEVNSAISFSAMYFTKPTPSKTFIITINNNRIYLNLKGFISSYFSEWTKPPNKSFTIIKKDLQIDNYQSPCIVWSATLDKQIIECPNINTLFSSTITETSTGGKPNEIQNLQSTR